MRSCHYQLLQQISKYFVWLTFHDPTCSEALIVFVSFSDVGQRYDGL